MAEGLYMIYDAFLSYNTKDCIAVETIALYLKDNAGSRKFGKMEGWEIR